MFVNSLSLDSVVNKKNIELLLTPIDVTIGYRSLSGLEDVDKLMRYAMKAKLKKMVPLNTELIGNPKTNKKKGERVPRVNVKRGFMSIPDTKDGNDYATLVVFELLGRPYLTGEIIKDNYDAVNVDYKYQQMLNKCMFGLYNRANRRFTAYSSMDFEQISEEINNGLVEKLGKIAPGFGLYLLAHEDIKCNFLSQLFIKDNMKKATEILDSRFDETVRKTYLEDIKESIKTRKRMLTRLGMTSKRMYQPNPMILQMLDRCHTIIDLSKTSLQEQIIEYEKFESDLTQKNYELKTRNTEQRDQLDERQKTIDNLTDELANARRVVTDTELQNNLDTEQKLRLQSDKDALRYMDQVKNLEDELRQIKGKLTSYTKTAQNQKAKINSYEERMTALKQESEPWIIDWTLKKVYSEQLVLVSTNNHKVIVNYQETLTPIFGLVEVIDNDGAKKHDTNGYDLVIGCVRVNTHTATNLLRHKGDLYLTFTGTPNTIKHFLFESLPEETRTKVLTAVAKEYKIPNLVQLVKAG